MPDPKPLKIDSLFDNHIKEIGREIFKRSQSAPKVFKKNMLGNLMMDWAMKHPLIKAEMFRFVDVLATLTTTRQITEHLREYFLDSKIKLPLGGRTTLKILLSNPLSASLTTCVVKKNIGTMANMFITGVNTNKADTKLQNLWGAGFCFTVDILGEAVVSEVEADEYRQKYIDLVKGLAAEAKGWKFNALLEETSFGKIPKANVSVKFSSLYSQADNLSFRKSVEGFKDGLRPVLREAVKNGVFINLDMEQNDFRELMMTAAEEIYSEDEFKYYPHLGIVIQAYLKDAEKDLQRIINLSKGRSHPLTVRLVKGAYWDYEVMMAKQRGGKIPVWENKNETDANYEKCTRLLFDNYPRILSAFASHNVRSIAHAMTYAESCGIQKNDFEFQALYGMADHFKCAVREMGYRIREYAPIGDMLPGMAYLVRRLLENSSNEGFLHQAADAKNVERLLMNPAEQK